jgi:hypothetical protein
VTTFKWKPALAALATTCLPELCQVLLKPVIDSIASMEGLQQEGALAFMDPARLIGSPENHDLIPVEVVARLEQQWDTLEKKIMAIHEKHQSWQTNKDTTSPCSQRMPHRSRPTKTSSPWYCTRQD